MHLELYVITDETISGGKSHVEIARAAIAGGADAIQLRDKHCGCRQLVRMGKEIVDLIKDSDALFLVNDRLDVAIACGADGVHIGQGDIRVDTARQIAPPGFIIGVSVGSTEEAEQAEKDGADYVACSPVFDTTSKNNAGPGHGLTLLRAICNRVSIPVIAIGGIGRTNAAVVFEAGADGIAVISAVVGSSDISRAAGEMKSLIRNVKRASAQL
jgi:thiamine-phosphate pyrophosphorylase